MRGSVCLMLLALAGCAPRGGPYPSLQPRAAEAIDPRVPVIRPINDRPVTPALAGKLSTLVEQARSSAAAFESAASDAERLAGAAGAPHSEGWIAAQEALTAASAARRPTANALGDIDELAAIALQTQQGIAPNDLAAIQRAAAEVGSIDARQAARIDAVPRRLGR
jgi:hypothetical protein